MQTSVSRIPKPVCRVNRPQQRVNRPLSDAVTRPLRRLICKGIFRKP
uniref:Uncharacterized protein n=1 Tax=Siphoviridae sp. ctBLh2 TaxID=2827803 RepID=A0A8S5S3V1_9CAUD|nr:MAG TPA: hypothetical protein [Siphoviridae sp. ctBLh2]